MKVFKDLSLWLALLSCVSMGTAMSGTMTQARGATSSNFGHRRDLKGSSSSTKGMGMMGKGMMGKGSKSSKGSKTVVLPQMQIVNKCYRRNTWMNCASKCSMMMAFGNCVRRVTDKTCSDLLKGLKQMERSQATTAVIRKVRSEKCTTPTQPPTVLPTSPPTEPPTAPPTLTPTVLDTLPPTGTPTGALTDPPTALPTTAPTGLPTTAPTAPLTDPPATSAPTTSPTAAPS